MKTFSSNLATFLLIFSTLIWATSAQAQAVAGFTGIFAPSNWSIVENPNGQNLVSFNASNTSVTFQNRHRWASSGSDMVFKQPHSSGTVSFTYTYSSTGGGSPESCPASYLVGEEWVIHEGPGQTLTFSVGANESFGFALNGQNQVDDFACKATYNQEVIYTVSNFTFTPTSTPT